MSDKPNQIPAVICPDCGLERERARCGTCIAAYEAEYAITDRQQMRFELVKAALAGSTWDYYSETPLEEVAVSAVRLADMTLAELERTQESKDAPK